ncbi:hypothetical protein HY346_00850 [Candidatus Microgenomates bacterium]|nr:hypothetical protein [Candidatus Microgenomates bacterium]
MSDDIDQFVIIRETEKHIVSVGEQGPAGAAVVPVGTAGTYLEVTTDAFGRVTAGANPTNLTALKGLTGAADKLPYFTGLGAMALSDFTTFGRDVIAAANAAALVALLTTTSPTFAALTLTSTLTLSGTAANIALGSNFISELGTDVGLSFSGANAQLSSTLVVGGSPISNASLKTEILGPTFIQGAAVGGSAFPAGTQSGILIFNNAAGQATIAMIRGDAAANNRLWDRILTTTTLQERAVNDAFTAATAWLTVTRSANTATSIAFTGTAATFSGTLGVTGDATFSSRMGIGASGTTAQILRLSGAVTSGADQIGFHSDPTFGTDATNTGRVIQAAGAIASGSFTMANLWQIYVPAVTNLGAAIVTTQEGIFIPNQTKVGTTYHAIRSSMASAANTYNLFIDGTADNAFAGNVRIGSTVAPTIALDVTGAALISTTLGVTGATTLTGGVAVGTTLKSWTSTFPGFQIGNAGAITSSKSTGVAQLLLLANVYHDSVDSRFEYIQADAALVIQMDADANAFSFKTAASGAAGGAITFLEQFQISHTAFATNYIIVTGSNGGNPTITTSAGSLAITPNVVLAGDLAVNGGDLTSTDTTFNLLNATVTTLNVGGASTATAIGAATGYTKFGNNVGINTTTFGTNAAAVLAILNGTAPTTGPADTVQFYSSDDAAGHTIPSFYCEGTNVLATGQADSVSSVRVKVRINGTVVTLLGI